MPRPHGIPLTPQERARIVELYKSEVGAKDIAIQMNVLLKTVYRHLHKANLTLNGRRGKIVIDCKDIFNFNEQSAYWMGFILADGYLSQYKQFFLQLAGRDADHLRKFIEFLRIERKISIRINKRANKEHLSARIWFCNKAFTDQLNTLGICRRKQSRIIPDTLKDNRHFWRGVIDGDGHIGETNGIYRLTLVGDQTVLNSFSIFAQRQFDGIKSTRRPFLLNRVTKRIGESICRLQFHRQKAARLIHCLYANHSISLARKQIVADRIMNRL